MPNFNAVHGVDYLIDYYALLDVERGASAEEITKAYRTKQKQYHPDRFQGLAPELLEQAEDQSNLINEAHSVLEDEAKRSEYDQKLADWKKPLSRRGEVIIDLNESHFSFAALLGHLNTDPEAREQEAETLALQFSGFEKATYEFFRKQAESPTGIPTEFKSAYLEQLERRDLYLSLRERFLWDSMGQRNHAPLPRLEYREQVQEDLESIKQQALQNVEQQVLLLAAGERVLLSAPEGMSKDTDADKVLAHYTVRFDKHFERQAALLEPLAAEREQILEAHFKTGAEIIYHPGTVAYTAKLVVEMKKGDGSSVWSVFEFKGDRIVGDKPDGLEELVNPEVARDWMERGYTILSFQAIQGVDFRNQLERALNLHAEKIEASTS